jgi:uncharacterized Zn finger protein
MKEEEMLECPFCGEETVKVIREEKFTPSQTDFGRDVKMRILGEPCSNCDKGKSEVKKKLKKKGYPITR